MTAYVTATVSVKDPEKLQAYLAALPGTLGPFGGQLVCRGKVNQALHGEAKYQLLAVFSFADVATAEAWYRSDAYQVLIPNRDEALEGEILILESP